MAKNSPRLYLSRSWLQSIEIKDAVVNYSPSLTLNGELLVALKRDYSESKQAPNL